MIWSLLWMGACEPLADDPADSTPGDTAPPERAEDTDGDGLSDAEEGLRGTDPASPDSDGDGLTDGDEVFRYLTDPLDVDTDDDTYRDPDELIEGTDPTLPGDRIYTGYWPYNPDKDALPDPGFPTSPVDEGRRFGRFGGTDRFGENVDLYDFAKQGRYVVIDASGLGTWCEPCTLTSRWLAGGFDGANLEPRFGAVRSAVDAGDVYWITVGVYGPTIGVAATFDDIVSWHASYPNERIPVLVDYDTVVIDAINRWTPSQVRVPSYALLDEDMTVLFLGETEDLLEELTNRLQAGSR